MHSQYHEGELQAQRLAGEQDIAEAREGMMQPRIAAAALRWLRGQSLLAVATQDKDSGVWASVIAGSAGFLHAEANGQDLWVDRAMPANVIHDLKADAHIGLLIIDLATRQRMRINGNATVTPAGLHVTVQESFFNCPKYITQRFAQPPTIIAGENMHGSSLRAEHLKLLHETDVLFMATTHSQRGLDASHRGGNPGFVQLLPDGRIRIPDYPGNSLFNSLGNLLTDSRIGIAVPNFHTGEVLQITGTATITWHDADPDDATGGTHRFVDIMPTGWRIATGGPVAGSHSELSPFNPHAL